MNGKRENSPALINQRIMALLHFGSTAARSYWQRSVPIPTGLLRQTLACYRYESTSSEASSESPQFAWRHSTEPIQRLATGDNLSGLPLDKQEDTFFQQVMLGSMLNRDWFELLFPQMWKDSLANDCTWAFQKGVAALLSRLFAVPMNEIDKEELGIVFDSAQQKETGMDPVKQEENESKDSPEDIYCSRMLEKKLMDLYANVDPTTTDLLFCMKPTSSKLESVFSVIFTREAVEEDASLVEAGRKMRELSRVARNPLEVSRILKELDQQKKPIAFFTIIVDVSIQCLEAFCVKEKSSGKIINGSESPQEVTHLVRFEVSTDLDKKRRLGSWRIVDWDDLLGGNVWY